MLFIEDPLFIVSLVIMHVGAKHLDLELSEFQKSLIKNNIIQAIILFGIVYIPVRDIFKTFIIVSIIYLAIYVLFNENNRYNIFSKQWLHTKGIIKEYNNLKEKYYKNISKLY
jgi:hypothetical protein